METAIRSEIERFVAESPLNCDPERDAPYFAGPLVGFARASDPLFQEYKRVIGPFHQTPQEIMAAGASDGAEAASVISWVLPIVAETRRSNRQETVYPSRAWARTRNFGEQFNSALRRHMVAWLEKHNHAAVAPQLAASWQEYPETPVGVASSWSERHAAYAAGLGTFSLNDALITPAGIAHRLGSVITDLPLAATPRSGNDFRHNCLYYREATCGACVGRCPVGALSRKGHDKAVCRSYVYGTVPAAVAEDYGVTATGCGLCQTAVPCESAIPPGRSKN